MIEDKISNRKTSRVLFQYHDSTFVSLEIQEWHFRSNCEIMTVLFLLLYLEVMIAMRNLDFFNDWQDDGYVDGKGK